MPPAQHTPVDERLATALLGTELQDQIRSAQSQLHSLVVEANRMLLINPLAGMAAGAEARRLGLRGQPRISVSGTGEVVLNVDRSRKNPDARPWKSELPSLDDLRKQAITAGIDPDAFGRSKRRLQEALAKGIPVVPAPAPLVQPPPARPPLATQPTTPVEVEKKPVAPQPTNLWQMGLDGSDSTPFAKSLPVAAPPVVHPAKVHTPPVKGRLAAIADAGKDLDVDALLNPIPPK